MKISSLCVGPVMTNCYILCDEKAGVCAVIDPGDEARRVAQAVAATGCRPVMILLTHGHFDHCSGVRELLTVYPELPVYIHKNDAVDKVPGGGYELKFPRLDEAHQRYYGEGDTLCVGAITLTVMETPGHSAGSVCLVTDGVIFAGDTLFYHNCGRCDLADGSYPEMLRSLGRLGRLMGCYHVYPGHDRETELDDERRCNPYMKQGMSL